MAEKNDMKKNHCIDCDAELRSKRSKRCYSCSNKSRWSNSNYRKKVTKSISEKWKDAEYKNKQYEGRKKRWLDPEQRRKRSEEKKALWKTEEFRQKRANAMKVIYDDPEYRHKKSLALIAAWKREDSGLGSKKWRYLQSEKQKKLWNNPKYREKQLKAHNSPQYKALISGPNHPNWRGGPTIYPLEFNNELRESIRDRDGRKCIICYVLENTQAHDVHHIDYNKHNNKEQNLTTLCMSCHGRTNYHRNYWKQILSHITNLHYQELHL